MVEKIGPIIEREAIIDDLILRLKELRAKGHPNDPEIDLLQKSLRLERTVLKSKSSDVSDYFYTGYAGGRIILWDFVDGNWSGKLCNRESGNMKKMGTGRDAEEMLRTLMPTG
jgi:hypothetical protein